MAEALGLVANLAGVIGAGLALSKGLYDFAAVLGSASSDVKNLATDISLFCSVLKHVQTTLTRAKAFRLSMSGVQTAEDIVDRCQIIFKDLQATIVKLQKGDAKLDVLTRVKWFFKEKRVLLIHEQLKTCTATLHLMLTTLMLAQKIASKRLSLEAEDDEDSQDRLMTHALFMAQQAANERLAAVEDEVILEEARYQPETFTPQDWLAFPDADGSVDGGRPRHRRNRSSQIINGAVHSPVESSSLGFQQGKRFSVIVGNHINRLSLVAGLRGTQLSPLDENRLSVLQTDELLRHWTDQSDPLASSEGYVDPLSEGLDQQPDGEELSLDPAVPEIDGHDGDFSSPYGEALATSMPSVDSQQMNENSGITQNGAKNGTESTFVPNPTDKLTSFRVSVKDPCRKVLPAALRKYGIEADWRDYNLSVVWGDQKRTFGMEEKPLAIFKELVRLGRQPMFMLQKNPVLPPQSVPHSNLPGGIL